MREAALLQQNQPAVQPTAKPTVGKQAVDALWQAGAQAQEVASVISRVFESLPLHALPYQPQHMLLLPPASPLHLPKPAMPVRLLLNHLMPLLPPVYQLLDMLPSVPSVVSVRIAVIGIHEQSRCATEGPGCTSSGSSL